MPNSFDLLDDDVQRWLIARKMLPLRDIQNQAIPHIINGNRDVLICAGMASGKTEAAFLPIWSSIARTTRNQEVSGFQALYLAPLKALINDQAERAAGLGQWLANPPLATQAWHGDVAHPKKQRAFRDAKGILFITPESLEAMLFKKLPGEIAKAFAPLSYIVIDELHAFIGSERGRQLQSLLHRLDTILGRSTPRIGLSATIGDVNIAKVFLRPSSPDDIEIIQGAAGNDAPDILVCGTIIPNDLAGPASNQAVANAVASHCRLGKHLVFTTGRRAVEEWTVRLNDAAESAGSPRHFLPHHSNLNRGTREDAESKLKAEGGNFSAVCTSTLELGIDIGEVQSVIHIGSPYSVASLKQRMGRSGRRTGAPILRVHCIENEPDARSSTLDRFFGDFFQTIAMIELMVRGQLEPPSSGALHLSTLIQQVIAVVGQRGGATEADLWRILCKTGPFSAISRSILRDVLRLLGAKKILRLEGNTLLTDERGEKIAEHFTFYVAFQTPIEWEVRDEKRQLGTLPVEHPLFVGDLMIFAGERWSIVQIDAARHILTLSRAGGGKAPSFGGTGAIVDDIVRQEMFRLYSTTSVPNYPDSVSMDLLQRGRTEFARFRLASQCLAHDGADTLAFLWHGDRVLGTIVTALRTAGIETHQEKFAIRLKKLDFVAAHQALSQLAKSRPPAGTELAATVANKVREKYDGLLTEALLNEEYASRALDVAGAWRVLGDRFQ